MISIPLPVSFVPQVPSCPIQDIELPGIYDASHVARLEALMEESKSTTTRELHASGVRTLCISEARKIDLEKFRICIEEILWEKKHGMDVYPCKGVLSIVNSDELHTLQAVRENYEIVPVRKWRKDEDVSNKIVFIGQMLNEQVLRDSIGSCTVES